MEGDLSKLWRLMLGLVIQFIPHEIFPTLGFSFIIYIQYGILLKNCVRSKLYVLQRARQLDTYMNFVSSKAESKGKVHPKKAMKAQRGS
jgi:hypothetical protein